LVTRRKLHGKLPRAVPDGTEQDRDFHGSLGQVNRIKHQHALLVN
jgi:hypothetical protein